MFSGINTLPYILPCPQCRHNLAGHYRFRPMKLDSREELTRWMYTIHNMVNEQLRSSVTVAPNPSYEEVRRFYISSKNIDSYIRIQEITTFLNYIATVPSSTYTNRFWSLLPDVLPNELRNHWLTIVRNHNERRGSTHSVSPTPMDSDNFFENCEMCERN